MEDLGHAGLGHQREQWREVHIRGQRVDRNGLVIAGDLHQAQQRIVGLFPDKFGVDGEESGAGRALAEGFEGGLVFDHGRMGHGVYLAPSRGKDHALRRGGVLRLSIWGDLPGFTASFTSGLVHVRGRVASQTPKLASRMPPHVVQRRPSPKINQDVTATSAGIR